MNLNSDRRIDGQEAGRKIEPMQDSNLGQGKKPWPMRNICLPADPDIWHGHSFACCLTHDIDHIHKYVNPADRVMRLGSDILRRKDIGMFFRRVKEICEVASGNDPDRRGYEWLLSRERKLGLKATYFFPTAFQTKYDRGIAPGELTEMVQQVEESGMEAGLHPGFYSFIDKDAMKAEKERFDEMVSKKPYGVRQHFLRLKIPATWTIQSELGFLYDSTLYRNFYPDAPPFPFQIYDTESGVALDLWEIPLSVMDATLKKKYRDPEIALKEVKKQVQDVARVGGVFCLLWHNSSLDNSDWHKWQDVYSRILEFIVEQDGWITSGREILNRWKNSKAVEDQNAGSGE